MNYNDLYWRGDETEIHQRIYIRKPEAIKSIKDIEHYNERAARAIAEAEVHIKLMKEYQQALYARYQEIYNTNYKLFLLLKRNIEYSGSKTYIVTIAKRFDGNNVADEVILKEKFEGRERHKALKRFETLKKEYPNIEHDTDIEKRQWER